MNIDELYGHLNDCLHHLQKNQIDDDSKLELELLAIQLKRQKRLQVFDPLKNLDNVLPLWIPVNYHYWYPKFKRK
jgi:hypothetical protein